MAKEKTGYDWKKTAIKFGISAGEVIIAGLIVYFTERPEFLILVPICEAARNWLKNRKK